MIFKTLTQETKVLRDPVHEYIKITDEIIWNLIDTKEFQRLKRIHQLGGSYQVYHGAEHSRFGHSLGVYEITRRMINEVKGLNQKLSDYEKLALKCAGLLHDVGHGPFSHAFEQVTLSNHEQMTMDIIMGNSEINQVLTHYHPDLPKTVVDIINHQHPRSLLTQIISAQLDADRMDYLLRDAYYSGVSYGMYDLERILRTMRVVNDQLVVKKSGIHAVEDYIMARYQMYWQVYYHPTSRAFEIMLTNIFLLIKAVYQQDATFIRTLIPDFEAVVNGTPLSIEEHYILDEATCYYYFRQLAKQSKYPLLATLAQGILNRQLFDYCDYTPQALETVKHKLKERGYDYRYALGTDEMRQRPYIPYTSDQEELQIKILLEDNTISELAKESTIVEALSLAKLKSDRKIFYLNY